MEGGVENQNLISIVKSIVVNMIVTIELEEVSTGAVLPWGKVKSVSKHLL